MSVKSILHKITPYIDRHMVLIILDWLEKNNANTRAQTLKTRLNVMSKTLHTTEYLALQAEAAGLSSPDDLPAAAKAEVEARAAKLEAATKDAAPYAAFIAQVTAHASPAGTNASADAADASADAAALSPIEPPAGSLDPLYAYSRILYDAGKYTEAYNALRAYRAALETRGGLQAVVDGRASPVLWGFAAAAIMSDQLEAAAGHLRSIAEALRECPSHLAGRLYLLHYALFVFFLPPPSENPQSHVGHADWYVKTFCFEDRLRLTAALQAAAPWYCRYLVVGLVASRLRGTGRGLLRGLTAILSQERTHHSDEVTEFVRLLLESTDVDAAQEMLRSVGPVLAADPFLAARADDFTNCGWQLLFETYCRAHCQVSVDHIGERMGLPADEAERWVVGLIRDTRIDARYDTTRRHLIIRPPLRSPLMQLRDRAKFLLSRTYQIEPSRGRFDYVSVALCLNVSLCSGALAGGSRCASRCASGCAPRPSSKSRPVSAGYLVRVGHLREMRNGWCRRQW
eukprot:TRINITY_DN4764_c0_g1_i2.p1 TRINITY_DN4764_c0_g1~~TRINITY_DN4764_c0_g1_i2.p1  ORF type:complete len:549 (+),score=106.24 TRINITY_DN4764_c0_g1_i2:106-1647(+)